MKLSTKILRALMQKEIVQPVQKETALREIAKVLHEEGLE